MQHQYMASQLDENRLYEYLARWRSPALSTRVRTLMKHYIKA